jgi:hypothetical protein
MNEAIIPYALSYTPHVRQAFAALLQGLTDRELAARVKEAAKVIEYRLRIYPQFGDPLRDFSTGNLTQWQGIVPPLIVRYVIDEERRLVMVGEPIRLMPGAAKLGGDATECPPA